MKPSELWTLILSAVIGVTFTVAIVSRQPVPAPGPAPAPRPLPAVKWQAATIEEALQLSAAHNRRVIAVFSAKWCPACMRMELKTLKDAHITSKLCDEFIFVKIDADQRRDLGKRYGIHALPTVLQLDATGAKLREHVGYMTADEMIAWLSATD